MLYNHCEAYSKTSCNLHHLHNFLLSLFQHRFLPGMLQDACRIFKRDHFVRTCSKSLHLLHLLSLAVRKLGACQVHSTSICCSPLTWKHIVTRFGPWPGPLCSAKGCIVWSSYDSGDGAACFSASPIFSKPTCSRFPTTKKSRQPRQVSSLVALLLHAHLATMLQRSIS